MLSILCGVKPLVDAKTMGIRNQALLLRAMRLPRSSLAQDSEDQRR